MAIPVLMPALSPTMTDGNLAKWLKKEGDKVSPGQIIAEIETDKAIMEMEVIDSGIISKILVADGTSGVKVNDLIAVISEDGDDENSVQAIIDKYAKGVSNKIQDNYVEKDNIDNKNTNNISEQKKSNDMRIFASPLAKRIAEQNHVDLLEIKGSGPNGRIIKNDVLKKIENNVPLHNKSLSTQMLYGRNPEEFYKIPVSGMRKVIANRLLESKQNIPHFYVTFACELDKLLSMRQDINNVASGKDGKAEYKISVNDLIIKVAAKAMSIMPNVNSSWDNDNIIQYNNVDISVAVSTDGGLITPIIRNADQKSVIAISQEMKELAAKARANKLKPAEFQGGGFSISNLGMYGIDKFDAIINPPQSCIMAVGAGIEKPVVKNSQIEIATVVEITLSCDHRIIDGAVAAQFANTVKKLIENPILILI